MEVDASLFATIRKTYFFSDTWSRDLVNMLDLKHKYKSAELNSWVLNLVTKLFKVITSLN